VGKHKNMDELFKGRYFDREVNILYVRWYLRFKLSALDLVEIMAKRGFSTGHTTIMRWVRRYVVEFVKCLNRFRTQTGRSWYIVETDRENPRQADIPLQGNEKV
jgi:transposase-like protein